MGRTKAHINFCSVESVANGSTHLVGGVKPSEKYESNLSPQKCWKIKMLTNNQPVMKTLKKGQLQVTGHDPPQNASR